MPGTFGTLLGIPVAWLFTLAGPQIYLVLAVALILFSSLVSELHERFTAAHDPSEIVIDEVAGYVVAITWLPVTWQSFVAAFLVFRIFDILKPFPISAIDRRVEGGLGTVMDDVAAGLAANILLQVVYMNTAWLGAKLGGL